MSKQAILDVLNSLQVVDSNGGDDAYILVKNTQEVREQLTAAGDISAANDPHVLLRYGDEETFCILAYAFGEGYANNYQGGKLVWMGPTVEVKAIPIADGQDVPKGWTVSPSLLTEIESSTVWPTSMEVVEQTIMALCKRGYARLDG